MVLTLRRAGIASALALAALWAAYYMTVEPSVAVKIEWREGLAAERRAALERRYLLVRTADADQPGWIWYDLLDTRRGNIAALLSDPDIADTQDFDRETMTVPFDAEYGKGWMWVAHRTPGLRQQWIRLTVAGVLAAVALLAAIAESRRSRV